MTATPQEIEKACLAARRYVLYRFHGHPWAEDVAQQAAIGVLRAAELFDPSKGASFKTFARRGGWMKATRLAEYEMAHASGRTQVEQACREESSDGTRRPARRTWLNASSHALLHGSDAGDDHPTPAGLRAYGGAEDVSGGIDERRMRERVREALFAEAKRRSAWSAKWGRRRGAALVWAVAMNELEEDPLTMRDLGAMYGTSYQNVAQVRRSMLDNLRKMLASDAGH